MMLRRIAFLVCLVSLAGGFPENIAGLGAGPHSPLGGAAWGQEISIESLPPSVVRTVPEAGDRSVDASSTTRIQVTFSKEMMDGSWSWAQSSQDSFPVVVGNPRYLDDKKTCVIEVKLEPKKTYVIWVNSQNFSNFKDTAGNPAVPYLLVFETR